MQSLRLRLMVAFVGMSTVLIVGTGIVTSSLIDRAVWGPLDAALLEEATTLETIWDLHQPGELAQTVKRIGEETDLGHEKFMRVTDDDGGIIAHYGPNWFPVPSRSRGTARATEVTTPVRDGHTYRVTRYWHGGGGWIDLGVNADDERRFLVRARVAIVGTGTFLLVSLAAVAWIITTRAVKELDRLAGELEMLEAAALDRRISPRQTSEVNRVVTVLNRQLARLEAAVAHLRRFAGDAAHELRTPVAALRARLEVTLAREASVRTYRDGLVDALEQTERIEQLAEALLTLAAIEHDAVARNSPKALVRLDDLAREVGEAFEPVAQEQGRTFAWRAPEPVVVRGEPARLKRLLLNLVENAFRHTPFGTGVELAVSATAGAARIRVTDSGPGIPTDELPTIFERFRRGRTTATGSGLGLAICHEIIAAEGGRIEIDSTPGSGTTVTVTFPRELSASG